MNITRHIAAFIIPALTLVSCDDIFRDSPNDKLGESEIWGNEKLLDEYTAGWYRNMDNGFNILVSTSFKNLGEEFEPWFGDQITVGRSDWYQAGYGQMLAGSQSLITSRGRLKWQTCYEQIRSINKIFENSGELPPTIKSRILGEAHFFRAYYYYVLFRHYGGALLIDRTFNPLKDNIRFARASYEEMVKFITDEAELAAQMLDESHDPANVGRATRGAAYMLKGKTYFWASGAHYQNAAKPYLGFPDDRSLAMLELAGKEYQRVIDLNIYDLIEISGTTREDVVTGYRNIFLAKNSKESIWEVQHNDDGNWMYEFGHRLDRDAAPPSMTGVNCAYNPTQNHVDEYRMENGLMISDPASGYDAQEPFRNRDFRFYANILYDGSMWKGHEMDIHYTREGGKDVAGADLTRYGSSTTASISRTGYYMAKFLRESQIIDNDETYASSQNYILWRYAELLLDYAEIDFKAGRHEDARKKINKIRSRVHMPELSSLTWDDIMNERRVELAFEKSTYWDLLRFNIAEEKMCGDTNPLYNIRIVYNTDGSKRITHSVINGRNTNIRFFHARQYYWPIPWDEIRFHAIEQNPDWAEI